MRFQNRVIQSDLTIVGAGMPGICAAIEASRKGLKVALINNRGFLGGNASPEIRIDICGADGSSEFNFYARETGIIEELRLENLHRNPQGNPYLWHTVLMDFVGKEAGIKTFLNTNVDEVESDGQGKILWVAGSQIGTEKRFTFESPLFLDDTGDGTVGYLAGASYRIGREARHEYNEKIAPEVSDDQVLLSTLSFYSKDTGRPAPFELPDFAEGNGVTDTLAYREIPDKVPGHSRYEGYRMQWFYETGHGLDQIGQAEEVIHEHRQMIYGIWDHIKNSGHYDSSQYDFEYISPVPGKRESRRLIGDHVLCESDIGNQVDFDDVIGYGGWSIDLHALEGFFDTELINRHYILNGVYQIPLRSCYTKDVHNLMVTSRCMSTSHVAFGTTRVMATLSILGQAMANTAKLCLDYKESPRDIGQNHLSELQDMLVESDLYIVSQQQRGIHNLMEKATLKASTTQALTITEQTGQESLAKETALIIPVVDGLEEVSLLLKVDHDTVLNYSVHTSKKEENYKPQVKLRENQVTLIQTNDFVWVTLPIKASTDKGKLMLILEANTSIQLGTSSDRINGVFYLTHRPLIGESTYTTLETHELLSDLWQREQGLLCFMAKEEKAIYDVNNLINGLHRNHGKPNLWLSTANTEKEEITLTFDDPTTLSKMVLTFDSDLDYYYDNLEIYHDFNVMATLVKDYQVLAKIGDAHQILAKVTDNYQRVNKLTFDPVEATEFKIVLEKTNGDQRFGLYEIRCY